MVTSDEIKRDLKQEGEDLDPEIFCLNCGTEISENAVFCIGCGEKIFPLEVIEGTDCEGGVVLEMTEDGIELTQKGFWGGNKGSQFIRYDDIIAIGLETGLFCGTVEMVVSGSEIKTENVDNDAATAFVDAVLKMNPQITINSKSHEDIFPIFISGLDDEANNAILEMTEDGIQLSKKGVFTGRDKGGQFIRYEDITTIELNKGLILSTIEIVVPGSIIKIRNVDKSEATAFVNNVQKEISERKLEPYEPLKPVQTINPMEEIKKAKELLDMGVITEEEFQKIKNKYLEGF